MELWRAACEDAPVRHSLAGRAETPVQARLLTQLRDEGPLSKAQLADALQVSRTTVGAEVGRLAELGLAVDAGPAASRGGRRSTLVDLSPDIRFAGMAIGATGVSVGVTDGRLTTLAVRHHACDIKRGPREGARPGARDHPQADGRGAVWTPSAAPAWGARPGGLPPRGLGVPADHAGLGRLPGP